MLSSVRTRIDELMSLPRSDIPLQVMMKTINSWHQRLKHMKNLGFAPSVIFDCGAFIGEWTLSASRIFPSAQFLLVEPNQMLIDGIKSRVKLPRPATILNVAVGEKNERGLLNVWSRNPITMSDSSLLPHMKGQPVRKLEVQILTLDTIAATKNLKPDLVKLDLQGAEFSALKGASGILKTTEVFIIEFGCFEAYAGRATPRQIIDVMYDNDYSLYDIAGLNYRYYDAALGGGDFFFVKNNSELRRFKGWSAEDELQRNK